MTRSRPVTPRAGTGAVPPRPVTLDERFGEACRPTVTESRPANIHRPDRVSHVMAECFQP
ncbi:hypothetical protein [Streptomyces sp. NBC_01334]|uniref:hypothetical protein n=1 Tax=Streptomyces sp. NBC_01334 TaxID=2903827 RepID=UPI002E0D2353|nr:hypothetical protein OG736_41450 [Streptomyces sp. NBC_01334]